MQDQIWYLIDLITIRIWAEMLVSVIYELVLIYSIKKIKYEFLKYKIFNILYLLNLKKCCYLLSYYLFKE